jgi:hypothetical protein
MKYVPPYGTNDPFAPYINGDPSTGTEGSIPPADAFNEPLLELHNLVAFSGYNPVDTDLTQVTQSVRRQWVNWAVDTGSTNALSCTVSPPILAYEQGTPLRVLVANTNTGACTINVSGLGVRAIRRPDGSNLVAGDIKGGGIASLVDDGAHYQLVNFLGAAGAGGTTNNVLIDIPYCADISTTVNLITAPYAPAITSLVEGKFLAVKVNNENSGGVTMNTNALPSYPVLRNDAQPLEAGDIIKNECVLLEFHGTYYQCVSLVRSQSVQKIPGTVDQELILYVRLDGNDTTGDGSANTAAKAFRTIQRAVAYILGSFSIAGRNVTIQLGQAGTYDGVLIEHLTQGQIIIKGDQANQDSYIIPDKVGKNACVVVKDADVSIIGVQLREMTGTKQGLFVSQGSTVTITNVSFSGVGGNNDGGGGRVMIDVFDSSEIFAFGNIRFGYSCREAISCPGGGFTAGQWSTLFTNVGNPVFQRGWVFAEMGGTAEFSPGFTTFSGGAQGPKFNVNTNSVIRCFGGGLNFLPGNQAGIIATGGVYIS